MKRWLANGYGMKIWPLMDIMYHKFYQFIHINSILMDSLIFIASMSSQYPFFWECPGLPRCFTAGVLVGLQGPRMDPRCHNHLQVRKVRRKNSWWYPHRRLVNGNQKQKNRRFSHSILKNRYTYWGELSNDDSIAPSKQKSRKNS